VQKNLDLEISILDLIFSILDLEFSILDLIFFNPNFAKKKP